jgi:hypothetical protein
MAATLGARGKQYFEAHYRWPVIVGKYLNMFDTLAETPPTHVMEPLPGRRGQRQRNRPPALEVVRRLPSGAVRPESLQEPT